MQGNGQKMIKNDNPFPVMHGSMWLEPVTLEE
jgi:hypothetical protein